MHIRALLAATCLLATGCTSGHAEPPAHPDRTGPAVAAFAHYVALGDSYTAGPFVPATDLADGCLRSDGNYPSQLAEKLHITDVTDVSCSAASTRDLAGRQHIYQDATVSPQLAAVHADTDLVTLGIGGNDFNLFATLVQECASLRGSDPAGSPCTDALAARGTDLVAQTDQIGTRVARSIRTVQQRAPDATVVLVGYPRLAPSHGSCPRLLPFATGDLAMADRVAAALNGALGGAARRTGVEFVDMYAASQGHDVCSADPWVNGRSTDRAAALAYHPFAAEMSAVADRIVARVS